MANESDNPVSLEELLRLKRHEAPASDFWTGFEREFQQRRLRALMEGGRSSLRTGVEFLFRRWTLAGSLGVSAAAAAVAVFVSQPAMLGLLRTSAEGPSLAQHPAQSDSGTLSATANIEVAATEMEPGAERSPVAIGAAERDWSEVVAAGTAHFVTDSLASRADSPRYRRVLPTATLEATFTTGSSYVADRISNGRTHAISAVYRPANNF